MPAITHQFAALNAKIERARRLVAEHRRAARGLYARDVEASKPYIIVHDLTNWLHSLEAKKEDLLRHGHLMAQRERGDA
jgi:hypothetical protein